MIRGKKLFKCTCCGKMFVAPDVEYCATVFTTPMPCPRCKSIRTRPVSIISFVDNGIYEEIWKEMEKKCNKQ